MFDLTDVSYVKRIVVGNNDIEGLKTEADLAAAENLLNRCLHDMPRGRILGIEKSFSVANVGEHQVVIQWLVYHVGFARRPVWLAD